MSGTTAWKTFLPVLIFTLALATLSAGEKYFVGHSWDLLKVTTDDLVRNLPELEKLPLDGISISLSVEREDGKIKFIRNVLSDAAWNRGQHTAEIENIRKISSGRLKHNLLFTNFAPARRLSWTDDAAWERAANNAAVMAWIVKESGLKGIMIDPEDYPRSKQFVHAVGDPPYAETQALARRRGAQIMKAMASENPEMVLLSFGYLSDFAEPGALERMKERGGLWPSFIEGMLDELPAGSVMVDGSEGAGYTAMSATNDFYRHAWKEFRTALPFISPENRAKFCRQFQIGFGLYLDMYTNSGGAWYHPPTGGSRLLTLFNNFSQAMDCADRYCWVYGEHFSWIKWDCAERLRKPPFPVEPETWDEKLPGFTHALKIIAQGEKAYGDIYAEQEETGRLVNLVANPECKPGKEVKTAEMMSDWTTGVLPPGWAFWRDKPQEGRFALDTTTGIGKSYSVKVESADNACFVFKLADVKPGQVYACEMFAKDCRNSYMRVRWMQNNGWIKKPRDAYFYFTGEPDAQGWKRAFGFVKVPPEATELVMLVYTKLKPGETAWYGNPSISLVYSADK